MKNSEKWVFSVRKVKREEAEAKIPSGLVPESFKPSAEFKGIIGQESALRALELGLKIKKRGFNIFVAGEPGTGRTSAVKSYLETIASGLGTPFDLCFVNNFQDNYSPIPIFVEPGLGRELKQEMERAIEHMVSFVINLKESKEFSKAMKSVQEKYNQKNAKMLQSLEKIAEEMGFVLEISQAGISIIPTKNNKKIGQEEFSKLPEQERKNIIKERTKLEAQLEKASKKKSTLDKKFKESIARVKKSAVKRRWTIEFRPLKRKFSKSIQASKFLEEAKENFISSINEIEEAKEEALRLIKKRYSVNLAVDNSRTGGAPVIIENNPSYKNLIGSIERESVLGTVTTDFTMIKAGSLLKANGGFLIIHAEDIVNALVWKSLKRSLITASVQIEDLENLLNPVSVRSLKPLPVPLDVKVILIGSYKHYSLLYHWDVEFREIFRIKAEFDWTMEMNKENVRNTANFLHKYSKENGLLPLSREAFIELMKFSSRMAGERGKISNNFGLIIEIISEADFYAREEGRKQIKEKDLKKSIESRMDRTSLFKRKDREMFKKGILKIDTEGEKIGQINGLTYIEIDGLKFGRPVKITASTGAGKGGIVDIEKEAALSGPIHTKGVLILTGLLTQEFAQEFPLTLSGKIVLEQSYSEIDGDSASAAEFLSLLSSIGEMPIKQNYAVTGSINQKGEIQPIGGVNEKIEGFYDVCKLKGIKDENGVVIPEENIEDLSLKNEVLGSMEKGEFKIYAVSNIKELAEFMMGEKYLKIHDKVKKRLRQFYELSKEE